MAIIQLFGVDIDVSFTVDKIKLFGVDVNVHDRDQTRNSYSPVRVNNNPTPIDHRTGKRKHRTVGGNEKKRPRVAEDSDDAPKIPAELLRVIERHQGVTEPIFLYQKNLKYSDATKIHNRLFVNKRDGFEKFLNDDEGMIVNHTTKGLEKIVCVDARGTSYNLGLKIWPSLNQLVITSEWFKLVNENGAQQGHRVQIWGYRDQMGRLRFAINFDN
ncbi:hypothetical protein ACS0TY_016908 [Phlomoides rotata]